MDNWGLAVGLLLLLDQMLRVDYQPERVLTTLLIADSKEWESFLVGHSAGGNGKPLPNFAKRKSEPARWESVVTNTRLGPQHLKMEEESDHWFIEKSSWRQVPKCDDDSNNHNSLNSV